MSLLIDIVSVFTAIVVVFYAYFKWTYQDWKRRNMPYLEPTVPFGNTQNPYKRTMFFGDELVQIYRRAKANGWKHCGLYALASPVYMPIDLEILKNVITKDFQYFVDRGIYTNEKIDPLSAHLFAIGGKKWRNLRTKLTPTFTSGKMKMMFQTLVDCGLILEKYFENIDVKEPVDIKDVLGRFSTDIIGSCAFGLQCNSFQEPNSPFRVYGKQVFTQSKLDGLKFAICQNFPNVARALGFRLNSKELTTFFTKVLKDTIDYRRKNNITRKDFLQLLLEMQGSKDGREDGLNGDGTSLTMDELAAQSFVFFIAGFETSSTTMTFALYELATHPEIQDKVREEIRSVLAKHDNQMTYDSINELKYMKQVVDETLRKYPPLAFVTRVCVEDYKVPGEDVVVPKGTKIFISIKGIHNDEEYYENPEVFDPERFTEENKKKRHHYAHIPFGEGPRICIGERFGIMQTKIGLTSILKNFKVKLNERTKLPLKMSVKSLISTTDGDMWLSIERL